MDAMWSLRAFVGTVNAGSFTRAGRELGANATSVSRAIDALEQELGVLLFRRSTRALRLTDDGEAFHARVSRILEDLADAKRSVGASGRTPTGTLRVDAPVALGRARIAPLAADLARAHPGLTIHLTLRDRFVDPLVEGVDVVVRLNGPREETLVARRLGESRMIVCAPPSLLRRRPRSPSDLTKLPCIGYLRHGRPEPWRLRDATHVPRGPLHTDDAHALLEAAANGAGLVWILDFMAHDHLRRGTLVEVLPHHGIERRPIDALYPPNRHLLPRVRLFIDHLTRQFQTFAQP